jgi:sugar O-acyltransferase (sialic acid O-acetyltransferase NeuD family)
MRRLIVLGAGGYGRAVVEAAQLAGQYQVVGFVDDRWPELPDIWGLPVMGKMAMLKQLVSVGDAVVPAIGNNQVRAAVCALATHAGLALATVVHPRAWVSHSAHLGAGTTVMAGAIIGTEAQLAEGVLVNAGAVLDHHAQVGAFAHVGLGARMGGGAVMAAGAWLKAGQTLGTGENLAAES